MTHQSFGGRRTLAMAREMVRLPGLDAPYPLPIGFAVGRMRGRESFSGGNKGRELIGSVESTMMRRPLRSTIGPRPRSSKGGSAGSDPAFGFQWAQKWPLIVWNSVGGPNRVLVAFRKTGM